MDEEVFAAFAEMGRFRWHILLDGMDGSSHLGIVYLDSVVDYEEKNMLVLAKTHLSNPVSEFYFPAWLHFLFLNFLIPNVII